MNNTLGFSLIGHPPNISIVQDYLKFIKPGYDKKRMSEKLLRSIFPWSPPFKAFDIIAKHFETTRDIHGIFVLATFFPEMLLTHREKTISKVRDAIKVSEENGAKIAALGGFTSIVDGQQGANVVSSAKSMAVTNGNTMTSALTIEGIKKICKKLDINPSETTMAIIGATGNIGKSCAGYFAGCTKRLILTASSMKRLEENFSFDKDRNNKQIEFTLNNDDAVKDADIVICVTSSSRSLFTPESFKSGAVVCDVGYPKTVSGNCASRPDIIVYMGGIAQMHTAIEEAKLWGLGSARFVFGCFAEAITIAMEGCYEIATVGAQKIPFENMKKLYRLGCKHGFEVAPFFNLKKTYGENDFQYIKSIR